MASMEQVPQYSVITLDDGVNEKLQISVKLPGVNSALEFTVKISDGFLQLHVPGRFKLDLPLNASVGEVPEQLKFIKSRSELKAILLILDNGKKAEDPPSLSAATLPKKSAIGTAPAPSSTLHDSFAADAARLLAPRRKSKITSNKSKPAQDPTVMSMGKDRIQEPLFEEWERPRRRNRNREKPTLSGFVKSTVYGKDRSRPRSADQEGDISDDDVEASISTPTVSAERKRKSFQRGESEPEEDSHMAYAHHGISADTEEVQTSRDHLEGHQRDPAVMDSTAPDPTNSAPFPDEDVQLPGLQQASRALVDEIVNSVLNGNPKYLNSSGLRENATARGDFSRDMASSHSEEDDDRSAEYLDSPRHWSVPQEDRTSSPSDPRYRKIAPQSSSMGARGEEPACRGGEGHSSRRERAPSPNEASESDLPPSTGGSAPAAQPESQQASHVAPSAKAAQSGKKQQPPPQPSSKAQEQSSKGKGKNRGKQKQSKTAAAKQETDQQEDIPAFHPPPPAPEKVSINYRERFLLKGNDVIERMERYAKAHRPSGTLGRFCTFVLLSGAALLVRLYYSIQGLCQYVGTVAPQLPLKLAARYRWKRVQTILLDCQKQPEGKIILGSATICLGLLMLYFWVLPLLMILVDLALATLIGLLMVTYWTLRSTWSLLSSIVIMLLWRPTFLLSLFATTNMRYGYALYGPVPIVQYLVVIWGGPMTIWSMKGGFSGLCSLPICLLATLWNISQLDVIVGLFLSTTCLDWIQLRPVWSRLLTLLLSIAYLYARGSPVFARSSHHSDAPLESVPDGAEGEIARVLLAKDFYDVLDVADTFEAEDLRRAKRKLSLATHPDKQQHAAGANQAFLRVTEAYDVLSNPKARAEYDRELKRKAIMEDLENTEMDDFHSNGVCFFCPTCHLEHWGKLTNRKKVSARWCDKCQEHHPAKNGDGWYETSGFFYRTVKMFLCVDDNIWDMTEWANCALGTKSGWTATTVNTHEVPYKFGVNDSSTPRSRKKAKQRTNRR